MGAQIALSLLQGGEEFRVVRILYCVLLVENLFLLIGRPPRFKLSSSSAASDLYMSQVNYIFH
ncbi:hypothetical protein, partial [Klebsiella pneumoniae]|uniref:hypothetical protein n=1 Tax=Klebsiella pneumoniae TaxID=573 RepID=UPI00272F5B06